jgi:hypothetical protein
MVRSHRLEATQPPTARTWAVAVALGVACVSASTAAQAVDRCVRSGATGDGSGSDWTNALATFPTHLVRGDTYYVAAGAYGDVSIQADVEAARWVYVKKATESAHGAAAGWDASYGAGPAVFATMSVRATDHGFVGGYVDIDGVTGRGVSGYGFVIASDDDQAELFIVPYYYFGNGGNVRLSHAELYHKAYVPDRGSGAVKLGEGVSSFTFDHLYVHDIPCNSFTFTGQSNVVIENSVIARNHSTASWHGQGIQAGGGDGYVIRNNWFEDIQGTAVIAMLSDTASNWDIYNNVFYQTSAGGGIAHGPFSTNSSATAIHTFRFYDNTIVDFRNGLSSRVYIPGAVSGGEVKNNLWYCEGSDCLHADNTVKDGIVLSHNWFAASVAHNQEESAFGGSSNPFVDSAHRDFRLVQGADPIDKGLALGAPYDVDGYGNPRPQGAGWDIGAFEYTVGGGDSGPPLWDAGGSGGTGEPADASHSGGSSGNGASAHGGSAAGPIGDGSAGASVDGSAPQADGTSDSSGCGCRVNISQGSMPALAGLVLSGLIAAKRRRRAGKRTRLFPGQSGRGAVSHQPDHRNHHRHSDDPRRLSCTPVVIRMAT